MDDYPLLSVQDLRNDQELRSVVRRYFMNWKISDRLGFEHLPGCVGKKKKKVKIVLDYPLYKKWKKIVEVASVGDIYCEAADLYGDIYSYGTEHVWGHSMSDLNFERMRCRKVGGKNYIATITFSVGS